MALEYDYWYWKSFPQINIKKLNKFIRKIVETIVEVLNSCPVIECQEITKEDSIKINVDKSVQDMLDKIGLVITEGDDDEHK